THRPISPSTSWSAGKSSLRSNSNFGACATSPKWRLHARAISSDTEIDGLTGLVTGAGALVMVVRDVGAGAGVGAATFLSSPPHAVTVSASVHAVTQLRIPRDMTGLLSLSSHSCS